MKPFRFSLQSVRVLRERKEQLAQQRYAEAIRAHDLAGVRWQRAREELAQQWRNLAHTIARGAEAAELRRAQAWGAALETRQQERAAELQSARSARDRALQELTEAARDRQALERLHDRHRLAHDRSAQRAEQKVLDEMGLRVKPEARSQRAEAGGLRPAAGGLTSDFRLPTSDFCPLSSD